jgi:RNA recognition motif-containing protein
VDELRRLFSPYGNIISAQVGAKDFGFVEFEFPDSVDRAIKGESGRLYRGLKLGMCSQS